MSTSTNSGIDDTSTVHDIIARHPATLAVFSRAGIDSCCGGGLPLREAASRHGADLDGLLRSLRIAIGEQRTASRPSDSPT